MGDARSGPVGVILAGGRGSRVGGEKARLELGGRPLLFYPLAAMRAAVDEVVVVAKAAARMPDALDVPVWLEPAEPQHPLVGIVHALSRAQGRSVLVCAGDMPFVTPQALRVLAGVDVGCAPAVVAAAGGQLQPQLARYDPGSLTLLAPAAAEGRRPLRGVVAELAPQLLELPGELLFNINTLEDLARAEAILASRR